MCHLHEAAPDLLAALKEADAILDCLVDQDWRDMNLAVPDKSARKAAITKATSAS